MKTRQTRTVGIVVSEMSNPFFQEIFEEITVQFAAAGLRSMVWHAGDHAKDAVAALLDRAIDGIVISALSEDSPEFQAALNSGRPLLLLNRITNTLMYDCVVSDNFGGGRLVADYLVHADRTDAVLVAGDLTTSTGVDRRAGFLHGMEDHGFPVSESQQIQGDFHTELAYERVRSYVTSHGAPDAFFCSNDAMAFATLNALHQLGVDVPRQSWVIGYDDVAAASWPLISLTTVSQSGRSMARQGAELLLDRLEDPQKPWQKKIFPAELTVRDSTGGFPPLRTDALEPGSSTG